MGKKFKKSRRNVNFRRDCPFPFTLEDSNPSIEVQHLDLQGKTGLDSLTFSAIPVRNSCLDLFLFLLTPLKPLSITRGLLNGGSLALNYCSCPVSLDCFLFDLEFFVCPPKILRTGCLVISRAALRTS